MELLAPAGSPDAVKAAVQSGAGAVYMGFGMFNARRNAVGFTREEMAEAISYCRVRGVKTNITFNVLALDREMDAVMQDAAFLYEAGADALIVQDLGVARCIHAALPDFELHASTQMTIHSLDGALQAKALGFSRVVLSRELSLADVAHITKHAGVETEIFVHGALCMCYSGQCYFSALVGQRSGNRGLCAQPCRLPYNGAYPLSLKDLSAADYIPQLQEMGVKSLKIEGRMKRPEYTAIVTDIYARLIAENRTPTAEEAETLRLVFSRDGFTDGYLTGQKGKRMFGVKTNVPLSEVQPLYKAAAARFDGSKELPRVGLMATCEITRAGMTLTLADVDGNTACCTDAEPLAQANNRAAVEADIIKQLGKLGGTPFYLSESDIRLEAGLMVPASRLNALRRQAVEALLAKRSDCKRMLPALQRPEATGNALPFAGFTASVQTRAQADALRDAGLEALYVPLEIAAQTGDTAILPRVFFEAERESIEQQLECAMARGMTAVVCTNIGHIPLAKRLGLHIIGDFGLNAMNSQSLAALQALGVTRQTLSFENRLEQLRDLQKPMETECVAYGYLPLMITENAIGATGAKQGALPYLKDRKGKRFTVMQTSGGRSTVLNSAPLWLQTDFAALGVTYARLLFTTESPEDCVRVLRAMQAGEKPAGDYTNGLYFRGVE